MLIEAVTPKNARSSQHAPAKLGSQIRDLGDKFKWKLHNAVAPEIPRRIWVEVERSACSNLRSVGSCRAWTKTIFKPQTWLEEEYVMLVCHGTAWFLAGNAGMGRYLHVLTAVRRHAPPRAQDWSMLILFRPEYMI